MAIFSLKQRWRSLSLFRSKSHLEEVFNSIHAKYTEPHRHYHTIEHIKTCLELLDIVKGEIDYPEPLEVALWFHDVIYNPRKNNNEKLSALFAKELLDRLGVNDDITRSVSELIMATKHPYIPRSKEEKYIVDIDLAVLGMPSERYEEYSKQIRKEYSHVPGLLYRKGRRKLLASFLEQNAIFNTEYFGSKFEHKARYNIEREIELLKSG